MRRVLCGNGQQSDLERSNKHSILQNEAGSCEISSEALTVTSCRLVRSGLT